LKKFMEIIKKKWLRDSVLTILLIAIIVAIFIALNMWMENLNLSPIDFTQEKLYTLSDESKEQLKNIEEPVTIYFFGYNENDPTINLAKQYSNINENFKTEAVKASERPDLANLYGISSDTEIWVVFVLSLFIPVYRFFSVNTGSAPLFSCHRTDGRLQTGHPTVPLFLSALRDET